MQLCCQTARGQAQQMGPAACMGAGSGARSRCSSGALTLQEPSAYRTLHTLATSLTFSSLRHANPTVFAPVSCPAFSPCTHRCRWKSCSVGFPLCVASVWLSHGPSIFLHVLQSSFSRNGLNNRVDFISGRFFQKIKALSLHCGLLPAL